MNRPWHDEARYRSLRDRAAGREPVQRALPRPLAWLLYPIFAFVFVVVAPLAIYSAVTGERCVAAKGAPEETTRLCDRAIITGKPLDFGVGRAQRGELFAARSRAHAALGNTDAALADVEEARSRTMGTAWETDVSAILDVSP